MHYPTIAMQTLDPSVWVAIIALASSLIINAIGVAMMLGAKKQELADCKADIEDMKEIIVTQRQHLDAYEHLKGWLTSVEGRGAETDRQLRLLQIAHGHHHPARDRGGRGGV